MRLSVVAAIAALGIAVSGCATVIDGASQSVKVSSWPEQGARCRLHNSEGTWYLTTPGKAEVDRTKHDLHIDCDMNGYLPAHAIAKSHFNGWTAGNLVAGGVVGLGVDAITGANFSYKSSLVVRLSPLDAAYAPQYGAPQYQASQYQAPQYPQYQAPQYQPQQYQAPQFQPSDYDAPGQDDPRFDSPPAEPGDGVTYRQYPPPGQ